MGSLVVSGAPGAPFASAISLEKADHLLWLGRYAERAYTTQKFILSAYDNAVRLRDVLGTESLGYVQMAVDALAAAQASDAPLLDLQLIQDNIMAFKGCVDDFVESDAACNLIKCGISVERIDLYARLSYKLGRVRQEVHRLAARVNRTGAPYSQPDLKALVELVYAPTFPDAATYDQLGLILRHAASVL